MLGERPSGSTATSRLEVRCKTFPSGTTRSRKNPAGLHAGRPALTTNATACLLRRPCPLRVRIDGPSLDRALRAWAWEPVPPGSDAEASGDVRLATRELGGALVGRDERRVGRERVTDLVERDDAR